MTNFYTESEATDDRKQVDAFLSDIDAHLNEKQRALAHVIMSADLGFGNLFDGMTERRSYPYQRKYVPKDYFGTKAGKARAKALKKRAKDKSNRKKARR